MRVSSIERFAKRPEGTSSAKKVVSQIKLKESLGWAEDKSATQKDIGSMLKYDNLRTLSKRMKREESRYSSLNYDSQEENDLFPDGNQRPKSAMFHSRNQQIRSSITAGFKTLSDCNPTDVYRRSTTVDDYTQMTLENKSTTDSKLLRYHAKQS